MLRYAGYALVFMLVVVLGITAGGIFVLYKFGRDLPDYHQLANYEPPVATRVHAGDGRLIAEFARQQRLFVPIAQIPKKEFWSACTSVFAAMNSTPSIPA